MFRNLFNRFLSSWRTLDFPSWPMDVSTPPHWLIVMTSVLVKKKTTTTTSHKQPFTREKLALVNEKLEKLFDPRPEPAEIKELVQVSNLQSKPTLRGL